MIALILFHICINFNKLNIKYQLYPKSTKINVFEEKKSAPMLLILNDFFISM